MNASEFEIKYGTIIAKRVIALAEFAESMDQFDRMLRPILRALCVHGQMSEDLKELRRDSRSLYHSK